MKRIAVVGAGSSGLTAIKCCKEEELDVVCFERSGEPGGLWKYHDEAREGAPSVMKTTIMNSSKEMSAYSDFPPPKEWPNYLHHTQMFQYLMLYAERFDLLKNIRYYRDVIKIDPAAEYEATGKWTVKTKNLKDGTTYEEEFDGVMVCTGHHVCPKFVTFPGQEKFKGTIVHSHSLKTCDRFKDDRVVVVGIGNSGIDAAVDCTSVSKKVFLSTRRGSWVTKRVSKNGMPKDIVNTTRFNYLTQQLLPFNLRCSLIEKTLQMELDHDTYSLTPKHRVLSAHGTVNDYFPFCMLSGKIVIKGNIERFEENGVIFEGESSITEIDSVILATGYYIRFPFLDESLVSTPENRVDLYKYMFPTQLKHPTLVFIGVVQQIGALYPISETQSRWFVEIFKGKRCLPSVQEMLNDIARKNKARARRYVPSTRHTIQVDFIPFMDEVASQIGAMPNLWKMLVTDPKLFWICLTGPCLPYQYRLQGPHPWAGARQAILEYEERVKAPLRTRRCPETGNNKPKLFSPLAWFFYLVTMSVFVWGLTSQGIRE